MKKNQQSETESLQSAHPEQRPEDLLEFNGLQEDIRLTS